MITIKFLMYQFQKAEHYKDNTTQRVKVIMNMMFQEMEIMLHGQEQPLRCCA